MLAVLAWSVGLSTLWKLGITVSVVFNFLGLAVGIRYCTLNSIKADQRSYYLYNVGILLTTSSTFFAYANVRLKVWVAIAHALPAYFRFVVSQAHAL